MKLNKISICLLSLIPISLIGLCFFYWLNSTETERAFLTEPGNSGSKVSQPALLPDNSSNSEKEIKQDKDQDQDRENENTQTYSEKVLFEVPFTSQAPFGEWDNSIYQDGCEEAAILMAMKWVKGESLSKEEAKMEINEISSFELDYDGTYVDRSATSTAQLIRDYYNYHKVEAYFDIDVSDIKDELYGGNLVIVPVDGRQVGNPHYTQPGPSRHMILIIGYDPETEEFITNDAGTRYGKNYRYDTNVLIDAVRDYPTGDHKPIKEIRTAMIVVQS